jgi:hypothetical protein
MRNHFQFDPFDLQMPLIFAVGPLCGTSAPVSTRGGCHLSGYPISCEILPNSVSTDRFSFSGKARINVAPKTLMLWQIPWPSADSRFLAQQYPAKG